MTCRTTLVFWCKLGFLIPKGDVSFKCSSHLIHRLMLLINQAACKIEIMFRVCCLSFIFFLSFPIPFSFSGQVPPWDVSAVRQSHLEGCCPLGAGSGRICLSFTSPDVASCTVLLHLHQLSHLISYCHLPTLLMHSHPSHDRHQGIYSVRVTSLPTNKHEAHVVGWFTNLSRIAVQHHGSIHGA